MSNNLQELRDAHSAFHAANSSLKLMQHAVARQEFLVASLKEKSITEFDNAATGFDHLIELFDEDELGTTRIERYPVKSIEEFLQWRFSNRVKSVSIDEEDDRKIIQICLFADNGSTNPIAYHSVRAVILPIQKP